MAAPFADKTMDRQSPRARHGVPIAAVVTPAEALDSEHLARSARWPTPSSRRGESSYRSAIGWSTASMPAIETAPGWLAVKTNRFGLSIFHARTNPPGRRPGRSTEFASSTRHHRRRGELERLFADPAPRSSKSRAKRTRTAYARSAKTKPSASLSLAHRNGPASTSSSATRRAEASDG